jgi:hypothetical protein
MTTSQLHEFARVGAEARLKAISEEQQAILSVFPELGDGAAPGRRAASPAAAPARKRRGMSAAQRKAVGQRMKRYWAKWRAHKKGATGKKAAPKATRKGGMSVEARKAQGERMKAYWAAKRAQKVNGAGEGTRSDTASQDGAPTSKRGGNAGRKPGRKK